MFDYERQSAVRRPLFRHMESSLSLLELIGPPPRGEPRDVSTMRGEAAVTPPPSAPSLRLMLDGRL